MSTQASGANKKPIHSIILRDLRQKIGSPIVAAKFFSCFWITIAPTKIPRFLHRTCANIKIVHTTLWHIQSFENVAKTGFIWQKLAVQYFLFTLGITVDITKVPVIEFLKAKKKIRKEDFRKMNANYALLRRSNFV